MKAVVWHLMMLLWLAAWLFGVWWVWPLVERMELTGDLVMALLWLVMCALAWVAAFNMGRQRYWRR